MNPAILLSLSAFFPQGSPAVTVPDEHVEAALAQAGSNAAELERALEHFAEEGDAQKLTAARFLVANMPGHGFVVTELRDADGRAIPYDPLSYPDYAAAQAALDALEREHGKLAFDRSALVKDLEVVGAAYLVRHVDRAFEIWRGVPEERRVAFVAFLEHVLPYRGSEEPVDEWLAPLHERYAERLPEVKGDVARLNGEISADVHRLVRFDERYYLHPTDQGYSEMLASGMGRCEDITNMLTYANRSLAIATAADYTPAWAHRDNNHAWNVLLDRDGKGCDRSNAHAAKVYRKTFSLQRDSLAFHLPEGREAPNRFMASRFYVDVTDQYAPTTDVDVELVPRAVGAESFAYICVFNGGEWVAVDWARIDETSHARFERMGRNIVYLPAVHRDGRLVAAAPPLLVSKDGSVRRLPGDGAPSKVLLVSVRPRQTSVDTGESTPISYLEPGVTYMLQRWTLDGWVAVSELVAEDQPLRAAGLAADGLYWMVAEGSRRLERVFTIEEGRQRWW